MTEADTNSPPPAEAISQAAQNRLDLFDESTAVIDLLFQQTLSSPLRDKAFDDFLGFMCNFSNLSIYNAMLVKVQRPGAIAVGNCRQWAKLGREVNPDAIPIVLLQAFGPIRFVYEYSDTQGKEWPAEQLNSVLAEGIVADKQYKHTIEAAKKYGVAIEMCEQYGSLLAGTAAALKVLPTSLERSGIEAARYRVRLNAKHDQATRFATLAHELGHIYCGHLGADIRGRWPNRSNLSYEQMEMEAEAVAWLVCQRTGVSPRSKE